MEILIVSPYRAVLYLSNGRQIEVCCSKGRVEDLLDIFLLPSSTEFKCLKRYNRALVASMEDTGEIEVPVWEDIA